MLRHNAVFPPRRADAQKNLLQMQKHWKFHIPSTYKSTLVENMILAGYNYTTAGHYDWHIDKGDKGNHFDV